MSKEPLTRQQGAVAPYTKGQQLVPALATAAAASGGPRRVHANNVASMRAREKQLPPDANAKAAPSLRLLQFDEPVTFACARCRRDGIVADSLAFEPAPIAGSGPQLACARCATRLLRPREYRPGRVVPFATLLSWLSHKPQAAVDGVAEDPTLRPAEAVAPSGARVAAGMLGGGPTDIRALPATPMEGAAAAAFAALAATSGSAVAPIGAAPLAAAAAGRTHPCERVWGSCAHGALCFFARAPRELCLAYLMGLCRGADCGLLHQNVFDLPERAVGAQPLPLPRRRGDLEDPASALGKWVAQRRASANRAEWQLWHNGPVAPLFDQFVPCADAGSAAPAFSIGDITSALSFIGK